MRKLYLFALSLVTLLLAASCLSNNKREDSTPLQDGDESLKMYSLA